MKTSRTVNVNGTIQRRVTLIEEYYNSINSTMEYKDFENICHTPFRHMRRHMLSGEICEFRFQYLGKFMPKPSTLCWLLRYITDRHAKGFVTDENRDKYINGIAVYMKDNPDKFVTYMDKIEQWIDLNDY